MCRWRLMFCGTFFIGKYLPWSFFAHFPLRKHAWAKFGIIISHTKAFVFTAIVYDTYMSHFLWFIPHRSKNINLERWLNIVWICRCYCCCLFAWWCAMWVNFNTSFLFHLRTFAMNCRENSETKNEILATSWALSPAGILEGTISVIESTFGLL